MSFRRYRRKSEFSELSAVKQALEDGMDPNVLWNEVDLVEPRLKGGCVPHYPDPDSDSWPHLNTPLHRATCLSDLESVELLLQHGADINLYNAMGRTPLHEAVWNENDDLVRFFLEHDADVNKATAEAHVRYEDENKHLYQQGGCVGLFEALCNSYLSTWALLVEAGAELWHQPWAALDLALLAGDRRAIQVLLPRAGPLPFAPPTADSSSCGGDHVGSSRELLAMARSKELVPPRELYEEYLHVLRQVPERSKVGLGATGPDIDDLIQCFFTALERAAGVENHSHRQNRTMCAACCKFQSEVSRIREPKAELKLQMHEDREHLEVSASKGCPLCGILADVLDRVDRMNREYDKGDMTMESRECALLKV